MPDSYTSLWERSDVIAALAALSVILLFIVERIITSYVQRKEYKRRWCLDVLVSPNLDAISDFFEQCVQLYQSACERLRDNDGEILHTEFNTVRRQENGNMGRHKRNFELKIIQPVQYLYPYVGANLTELVLKIQDEFSTRLSNDKFEEDDIIDFQSKVFDIKALWLKSIYCIKKRESKKITKFIKCLNTQPNNIS